MEILNQLLVRFPKWVVSWALVVIDTMIGYYVINNIIIDTSNTSINYSIFSIFIVLQTFWCFIFWATNL